MRLPPRVHHLWWPQLYLRVMMRRYEGDADYWEATRVIGEDLVEGKDLDTVLETAVKAVKRQVKFSVTLEFDIDLPDNNKQHLKRAATALAEFAIEARERLAPPGRNIKKVTAAFRGGSAKKTAPAKKKSASAKKKAAPAMKSAKRA